MRQNEQDGEIKDNVRRLRKEAGMTQQEFADYFGIPKRNIENWEEGSRRIQEYWLRLLRYKLEKEGRISTGKEG